MAELICRSLRDGSLEGEHSPALTIKDTLETCAGTHAFDYFLCSLAANIAAGKSQARGLVLVAFGQSPLSYISLLKRKGLDAPALEKFLRILDCYSDPLGWKEKILQCEVSGGPDNPTSKEHDYVCRDVNDITKLLSSVLELGKGFAGEGRACFAVAIDSTDLHEPKSAAVLEYNSSIVASLEPMVQTTEDKKGSESLTWFGRNSQKGRFHVRFKRRNGRVKIINEQFHKEQTGISFVAPSSENMVVSQNRLPKLQFNLLLSEKERDDRAKVVLPFEHQGSGEPIHIYDGRRSLAESNLIESAEKEFDALSIKMKGQIEESIGEIHYVRDSDDEKPDSDEDPDDDLDI